MSHSPRKTYLAKHISSVGTPFCLNVPANTSSNLFLEDTHFCYFVPYVDSPVTLEYPPDLQFASLSDQPEADFVPRVNTASILDPNMPITPNTTIFSSYFPHDEDFLAIPPLSRSSLKCKNLTSPTSPDDEPPRSVAVTAQSSNASFPISSKFYV